LISKGTDTAISGQGREKYEYSSEISGAWFVSDIKLFQFNSGQMQELVGTAVQVEKSLQLLFEGNLESLLGIRFLASEHTTGSVHGGRIDTLGLDEDNLPGHH
jgi:hypothetical protein